MSNEDKFRKSLDIAVDKDQNDDFSWQQLICNIIGATVFSAMIAILAYISSPAEYAVFLTIAVFVFTEIVCGVFIYFHPVPIVANVP